jgi:hypothetical protein
VRGLLLGAFALGLATSISLAELALVGLAVVCLGAAGGRAPRERLRWPLLGPLAAFAAWTLVSVLVSGRPVEG